MHGDKAAAAGCRLVVVMPWFCFDDWAEQSFNIMGMCNVMAEILLSRYDLFGSANRLTHLTTNLSATEIEDVYGGRVRSRTQEMFNVVAFGGRVKR